MPKITGQFYKLKLPKGDVNKSFDEAAQRLIRQAARAWIREVILHVPVWSGMALGSIKFAKGTNGFLARYLNVQVPISPKSTRKMWYYHVVDGERVGKRIRKTPMNGGRFARYTFTGARKQYRFFFRSDVIHYIINEFYRDVSPESPWNSMEKAGDAFKIYIANNYKRLLPKVSDYVVAVKVPFGV